MKEKSQKKKLKLSLKVKRVLLLLFSIGIIGLSCGMFLLYGPISWFRNTLITTAMTTMSHQYLAKWFYSDEYIKSNLMKQISLNTLKVCGIILVVLLLGTVGYVMTSNYLAMKEVSSINKAVQKKIDELIVRKEDTVVYYPICVNCFTKIVYQPKSRKPSISTLIV